MIQKLKGALVPLYTFAFCTLVQTAAFAESYTISPKTGADLGQKIKQLVTDVGMPIGGAILFLAVVIISIEMMLAKGRPEKRAETMSGIMYVAIGGILLGGALFIAGAMLGAGTNIFK